MYCDSELVRLARNGDRQAFDELIQKYRPLCVRKAKAMLRTSDAEDEVQDAVLQAFLHLQEFELRASFSTWLVRIVLNRCLMTMRHNRVLTMASLDAASRESPAPRGLQMR